MGSKKLRILVMRDNEPVRSMRLSPGWFTLLIWLFVILACVAGLAGATSWWLYEKYVQFQEADQEKDRQIVELRYQLERCRNMERFVGNALDDPALLKPESTPPKAATPAGREPARPDAAPPKPEATPPAAAPSPPAAPAAAAPANVANMARLSNVTVNPRSRTHIRLSFDISNTSDSPVIGGNVLVALQRNDGRFIEASPPRDEMAFQIARFKRVATLVPLPDGVGMNDVKAVRVQVRFANGATMPPEVFPLPTPPAS